MIIWRGGPYPPLYIRGDRITWKVLAEYSWSPTTTRSGSFLCTAASSTPIRVVTKEVRYIYELSLTLEYSMSVSSPAAPGLTNILTFSQSIHGQQMADKCQFNLSASAAAMNDFTPLKYSSQVRLSRYIYLWSPIYIVKQENYQYSSKMNTIKS